MKAHGVGEDEVERCKLDILADLETAYLERDQIPSADHAAEAIEHFLRDEPLIDLQRELERKAQAARDRLVAEQRKAIEGGADSQ